MALSRYATGLADAVLHRQGSVCYLRQLGIRYHERRRPQPGLRGDLYSCPERAKDELVWWLVGRDHAGSQEYRRCVQTPSFRCWRRRTDDSGKGGLFAPDNEESASAQGSVRAGIRVFPEPVTCFEITTSHSRGRVVLG